MLKWKNADKKDERRFERIGCNLYRRSGLIYCRVWVEGKRTFRCTGTDDATTARKILKEWENDLVLQEHGIETRAMILERNRLSVGQVLKEYEEAGFPDRKMRSKTPATVQQEQKNLPRLAAFFREKAAISLTLKDCDAYRQWRAKGGYTWKRGEVTQQSRAGTRIVDIELQTLGNALTLSVRQGKLKLNPLAGRPRYHAEEDTRHCRETAPTAQQLQMIDSALRQQSHIVEADCVMFLAFSGLRVGEALPLKWEAVNWDEGIIHVRREKRGINPFVPILPEMEQLLKQMQTRIRGDLLFPSVMDASKPLAYPTLAKRLSKLCRSTQSRYVTLHGLRSYFVTQCRESGLPDAEIAALIGDKTGPAIIAQTYGDVRPDHLLKQAKRVRLLIREKKQTYGPKMAAGA
jgi:integrase